VPEPIPTSAIEPLRLAERIVARDPALLILDLRGANTERPIPGAVAVSGDSTALPLLADAVSGQTTVVVYDAAGSLRAVPGTWPRDLAYVHVEGGHAGWVRNVLTPAVAIGSTLVERERVDRQRQLAAFFTGAAVQAPAAAPPPAATRAGPVKKKKPGGGC